MGYFSNGTEGEIYMERYCNHCVHDVEQNCPIWLIHLLYNGDEDKQPVLDDFITIGEDGWNEQCKMFIPVEE